MFPQTMLEYMLPVGAGLLVKCAFKAGRKYPKECKETRLDIDKKLSDAILQW